MNAPRCNWLVKWPGVSHCPVLEGLRDIGNGLLYCPEHYRKVRVLRRWLGRWMRQRQAEKGRS